MSDKKRAIIIGAGPAGLTAAFELITKTDIKPIIYEMSGDIGGISKTINYKGNRIDIGGHRFFSKSDKVMNWWQNILPLQGAPAIDEIILDKTIQYSKNPNAPDPQKTDKVFLIRNRLSRIFFLRKFFNYPISLNINTFINLGLFRVTKILLSYIKLKLFPIKEEKSLEDFFINRFGKELYNTFFKDYTEKVWGVPCNMIRPEWGVQRIKGLSISKALLHAIKKSFLKNPSIQQKNVETSLIEKFLYPKFGPGQMWEEVAKIIVSKGGEIFLKHKVVGIKPNKTKIQQIEVRNEGTGDVFTVEGDYFFSTMPIKDLIYSFSKNVPENVLKISQGLIYRDFITVGLLLKKLKLKNNTKLKTINNIIPDNWVYIQEKDVKVARIQIFNNWSPYLVNDLNNVWIGLEYICSEEDEIWEKTNEDIYKFAIEEMLTMGFIDKEDVIDYVVIRINKAYPAYFGTYDNLHVIREFTDKFENLFLIGRNGMHRYNNQDHSMLTAMTAVENILNGVKTKDNIWNINAEQEYHEEASTRTTQ